jgi:hypothetical protein
MKLLAVLIATSLFGSATAFAPSLFTKKSIALHKSSVPGDPSWGRKSVAPKINKAISIKVGDKLQKIKKEDVVIDPDYYLTWCFALVGALITWYHPRKFLFFLLCLNDLTHQQRPGRGICVLFIRTSTAGTIMVPRCHFSHTLTHLLSSLTFELFP